METVAEVWRLAPRFPNYEASSLGRVRSIDREVVVKRRSRTYVRRQPGVMMKPIIDNYGYMIVNICHDGEKRLRKWHRIVADAFHGPSNGLVVNHINGNKHDNRPENLEYVTPAENTLHAVRTGLNKVDGENNPRATLREHQAGHIRDAKGNVPASDLSAMFGVSKSTVYSIWQGKTWRSA